MPLTKDSIHPDMTMGELLEVYPGAQRAMFRQYHIGGCSHCGFDLNESLASVCKRNEDLPPGEVVEYLLASEEEDSKLMIEPEEMGRLADSEKTPVLLDIRTKEEFDAVQIPGSRHFDQHLMQKIQADWDRSESIVIIDHDGSRSLDAASFFAGHGFTRIRALNGGIDAYSEKVDPGLPRYTLE